MYAKLFASLYQGTLRGQSHSILVFTNMLAHADQAGCVDKHFRAIAEEVGLTIEEVRAAIDLLEAPDPESRSPDEDGRRLMRIADHRAWGWTIVNYGKYREIRNEEDRKEANRMAQQRWRERQKARNVDVTERNGRNITNNERNGNKPKEKEKEKEKIPDCSDPAKPVRASEVKRVGWTPEGGWAGISDDDKKAWSDAYPACDIERQLSRMDLWLRSNPAKARKSNFYRFAVNWLQREQNKGGDLASNRTETQKPKFQAG